MKYIRNFEDDDATEVWTYDLNKFKNGPISIDIKYKNALDKDKNWNKRAKEAKDERRTARQMKKINNKK